MKHTRSLRVDTTREGKRARLNNLMADLATCLQESRYVMVKLQAETDRLMAETIKSIAARENQIYVLRGEI